jgi:hypothetical protein
MAEYKISFFAESKCTAMFFGLKLLCRNKLRDFTAKKEGCSTLFGKMQIIKFPENLPTALKQLSELVSIDCFSAKCLLALILLA